MQYSCFHILIRLACSSKTEVKLHGKFEFEDVVYLDTFASNQPAAFVCSRYLENHLEGFTLVFLTEHAFSLPMQF